MSSDKKNLKNKSDPSKNKEVLLNLSKNSIKEYQDNFNDQQLSPRYEESLLSPR